MKIQFIPDDTEKERGKEPVLGESSGLIGTDGGGGAKGLDSLQILHQAIFRSHSLGGQGQTHGDGSQQT